MAWFFLSDPRITALLQIGEQLMATNAEILAQLAQEDSDLQTVAANVQALKDALNAALAAGQAVPQEIQDAIVKTADEAAGLVGASAAASPPA